MRILEPKNVFPILHIKHVFLALEPPKIFFFQKKLYRHHILTYWDDLEPFLIWVLGGGATRRKNSLHPEGLKFRTQLDFLKQPQHAKKKTLESDIVHSKVDNIDIFRSRGILSTIGHSSSGVAEWTIIWPLQPPSLPENSVDNIVLVRSLSLYFLLQKRERKKVNKKHVMEWKA